MAIQWYARPCVCSNFLRYSFEISCIDSSSKIIEKSFFKSGLSPFVELCPFERFIMMFYNQDILTNKTAMSFKLGQVLEDDE